MMWVLAFIIVYVIASILDARRINGLYAKLAKPGRRKPLPEVPPAPRLAINLPPKTEHPPSS